jgi:hypothetical protein
VGPERRSRGLGRQVRAEAIRRWRVGRITLITDTADGARWDLREGPPARGVPRAIPCLGAGGAGVERIDGVGVGRVWLVQGADPGVRDGNHRDGEQCADDADE